MLLRRRSSIGLARAAAVAALRPLPAPLPPLTSPSRSSSSRTALIKELRARTSAPMKKCVDALNEADGDVDAAATILRKAGLAAAAKKASRGATDGATAVARHDHGVAVIELNSETTGSCITY